MARFGLNVPKGAGKAVRGYAMCGDSSGNSPACDNAPLKRPKDPSFQQTDLKMAFGQDDIGEFPVVRHLRHSAVLSRAKEVGA